MNYIHLLHDQRDEYHRQHDWIQSKGKGYVATPTPHHDVSIYIHSTEHSFIHFHKHHDNYICIIHVVFLRLQLQWEKTADYNP